MQDILRTVPAAIVEITRVAFIRRSFREIGLWTLVVAGCIVLAMIFNVVIDPSTGPGGSPLENGPSELIQAGLVAAAGILLYFAASRFGFELFYASLTIAFLCAMAFVRETPRCGSTFYDSGPCLTQGAKDLVILAFGVLAVAIALLRRVPLARHIRDLNFYWTVPMAFSAALLAVSAYASSNSHVWLEETSELASYLNILAFALAVNVRPESFDARLQSAVSRTGLHKAAYPSQK